MVGGCWRVAIVVVIIVMAARDEQEYVIWRSSAVNGFTWEEASRAYASKAACEAAVQSRKRWVTRTLDLMRRIGADDTLQRTVGDRIYECRPTLTGPAPTPVQTGAPQSP